MVKEYQYDQYYAKSDGKTTIEEHNRMVLEAFNQLLEQKGQYFDELLRKMIRQAICYHDVGKANVCFQEKMRGHYQALSEIPHGYLSALTIDRKAMKKILLSKENVKTVLNAVYYHHHRKAARKETIIEMAKNYFAEQLKIFSIEIDDCPDQHLSVHHANLNLIYNRMTIDKEEWLNFVLVKGILNRCDWSASGNLPVEIEAQQSLTQNVLKRFKPNEAQAFMMKHQDHHVALIASTGTGKTEAALLWLNDQKGFFTLPMRVSANAIYERIKQNYLLPIDDQNKVSILHGDCFKLYINDTESTHDIWDYRNAKNLSYPLTVCTIDQIIRFVYMSIGTEHLLATLKYSRLIIDELQAYSPDMLATIIMALKQVHRIGGKFAIITATLPQFILEELEECEIHAKCFLGDVQNRHRIQIHEKGIMDEVDQIIQDAKNHKVLVICNTVRSAQSIYQRLQEEDVEDHLLHARFTKRHRACLEKEVLDFSQSTRTGVCIATQIVEASLDIDFDILYTSLSSIDSLIQRMGRIYRKRENHEGIINVHVFTERVGIGTIYDPMIFERTLQYLQDYDQKMFLEEDKIECLNQVYDRQELENTNYMKAYQEQKEYLEELLPMELDPERAKGKFRHLHSIQILPECYYHQKEIQDLIDCIKHLDSHSLSDKYKHLAQLYEDCVSYTIKGGIKRIQNIDAKSVIDGEEIYRATCIYDFDEQTHTGRGLVLEEKDDEEIFI